MTKYRYTEPAKEKTVAGFVTHIQLNNDSGQLSGNVILVTSEDKKLISERPLTEIELGKFADLFISTEQTELGGLGAVPVADVVEVQAEIVEK